jgi:tetratricopeptide (TPR) repeat protein
MREPDLPGDVRATIERRVDLLADDTRRMLAAASVLGRRFDVAALAATTHLDPLTVTAALADAVAAEVVIDEGDGHYLFAHALIEATLYDGLAPSRRARLHRAAADAYEHLDGNPPQVAVIAHHYFRALPDVDRRVAVDASCRAAMEAAGRGACAQAVQHYEHALDAATGGDDSVLDASDHGALLCELGAAYESTGEHERAQAAYSDAIDLARKHGNATGLAHAALGLLGGSDESVGFNLTGTEPELVALLDEARAGIPSDATELRALVTARLAGAHYDAGDVEIAQALSADALDLARRSGDARAIAIALAVRHSALSCPEALPDRLLLDDELGALGRPFSVQAEVWRVGDLLEVGDMDAADATMDAMEQAMLARSQPRAQWYELLYRTMRAQVRGDIAGASKLCEDARRVGQQIGARTAGITYAVQSLFVARERRELDGLAEVLDELAREHPHQPGFRTTAAWVRVQTGALDEARAQFEELAAEGFDSIPRNGVWLANMRLLTEIAYALGAAEHAAALYALLLPYRDRCIVTSRVVTFLGSVEHPLGLLALTAGDLDAADDHLSRARAKHTELGATLLTARVDIARAALHAARGDLAGADALRTAAREEAVANGWADVAAAAA